MNRRSTCTGIGLIALDVIMNGAIDAPPKFQAGGSCGNVLAILAFLQWESYPIGRLANNFATKILIDDLQAWEVRTPFLSVEDTGSTPIIIHRILKGKNGEPKHKFEFRDPKSGSWLPRFKAVIAKKVQEIESELPDSDVHYFDRVSRSSIELAKIYKDRGALIVFEPTSVSNEKQFLECLEVADILKFANDRLPNYRAKFNKSRVPLEIETAGKEGLSYRFRSNKWIEIGAFEVADVVDAAGAGDWCTAGFINKLGLNGRNSFEEASEVDIVNALRYGQALSAINCKFNGARGIMYNFERDLLDTAIQYVHESKDLEVSSKKETQTSLSDSHFFDIEQLLSLV